MPNVLVLANETIGGAKLLDAVRERAGRGDEARFHVVVPQTRPRHGNVIYDDVVRDSAQVRVDLALEFMSGEGIEGSGEVGDGDPLNAVKDAVAEQGIDEIIISTLPSESSGWLRRDLPERLREETCHSSVSARHGFASARAPVRHERMMLKTKISVESPRTNDESEMNRFQPANCSG